MDMKLQASNIIEGFTLIDDYSYKETKKINFKNIYAVNIDILELLIRKQ